MMSLSGDMKKNSLRRKTLPVRQRLHIKSIVCIIILYTKNTGAVF